MGLGQSQKDIGPGKSWIFLTIVASLHIVSHSRREIESSRGNARNWSFEICILITTYLRHDFNSPSMCLAFCNLSFHPYGFHAYGFVLY